MISEQTQVRSLAPCPSCDVRALVGYQGARQFDCKSCGAVVPTDVTIPRLPGNPQQRPLPQQVVYYVRFGDRVKIGTTADLARRLSAIPHDEVLATEPGGYDVERRRHTQLRASRVAGQREWFHLTEDVRAHIAGLPRG